jgi:hypothetical protein
MTVLASKEMAHCILEHHLGTLKTIMFESLQGLNRSISASGESPNNRAKCSWFHSIAIEKAKKALKDCTDVVIKTKYQSLQIIFDGQLVGRIKKVNNDDLTSNAKTHRNQLILSQQPTLFPDLPSITYIDIAWRTDSTWSDFEKLLIICRQYDDIKWRIPYKDVDDIITSMQPTQTEILTIKEEQQIKVKKKKAS